MRTTNNILRENAALQNENRLLQERLEHWKSQVRRSDRGKVDQKAVEQTARALAKQYSSEADVSEIAGDLQRLYGYMTSRKDASESAGFGESGKRALIAAYTAGQNDAAAARSERLQDARVDGKIGKTKYSLKEEPDHGGTREETREDFKRRCVAGGYSVFEGETTAYGYRGPVQLGHETAARSIREELQKLGINGIIADGSVLWNRNGYTEIR